MSGFLGRFSENFQESPLGASTFLLIVGLLCASGAWTLWKRRPDAFLWICFGLIAAPLLLTSGDQTDDARHHIYRIVALADQVRHGDLSLMFQNDIAGETLPVFVFYSVAPYLFPTALNLIGLKAALAYKIALVAYLAIFALGLWRISCDAETPKLRERRLWAGCLLLTSTYVFSNWIIRSAYGEISVYAFIPWAILYAGGPRRNDRRLLGVFALQAICHPIVVAHSMIAQSVGGYALSQEKFLAYWLRVVGLALASFVIALPFWAPQLVWEHTTLGARALSLPFAATFIPPVELANMFSTRIVGVAILLAAALATITALHARNGKALVALGLFWVVLVLQTTPLVWFTVHIPVLDKGQLVWRLMFVCAGLAYAAFLCVDLKWPRVLVSLAALNMAMFVVGKNVNHSAGAFLIETDRNVYAEYSVPERPFGGLEFYPDYGAFRRLCSQSDIDLDPPWSDGAPYQEVRFSDLRAGVVPSGRFIQVRAAPYEYVTYLANGKKIEPLGVCHNRLVFGPLTQGETISVDETKIDALLWIRLILALSLYAYVLAAVFRSAAGGQSAARRGGSRSEQKLQARIPEDRVF